METVLNIGLNDASVRGPGHAGRQRAVRLGLLPAADPDVRQDRARHRGHEFEQAIDDAKKAKGTTNDLDLDAADLKELVGRSSRSSTTQTGQDFPQDPREQLDMAVNAVFDSWNADRAMLVPPPGADPGRPRHRGQHRGHGVRQPRRGLRHRRGVHPRPGQRRSRACTATTCRTRRARTSWPASATRSRCRPRADRPQLLRRADADHADAGEPLPRPVRHRVHDRARQALDAADPGRQAHRAAPPSGSPPSWSTRASSTWTRPCAGSTGAQLAQLMFPRFGDTGDATLLAQGISASPGAAVGKAVFDSATAVEWAGRARTSSWSAARPTPTTWTA